MAIVRLRAPSGIVIDLLAASSGIEREIVDSARVTDDFPDVPVAATEHLLAMKILSMREARLQDRIDARSLIAAEPNLVEVRRLLDLITERGYARGQQLIAKLDGLIASS